MMKFLWSKKSTRVWMLVTAIVLVVALAASIVLSFVPLVFNAVCMVLGGERNILVSGDPDSIVQFEADYKTKAETLTAAGELNLQIASEAMVLLKNDNSALPLAEGAKISVFGKNSANLVYGGSGSAAGNASRAVDLKTALTSAGFKLNPTLIDFYDSSASGSGRVNKVDMNTSALAGLATGETAYSKYTSEVINSYSDYNDAALIVISRMGGEGWDLPRTMMDNKGNPIEGAGSATDHYLELDANEKQLIAEVTAKFDKVVVVMNTAPQAFEMGFLADSGIDAAIWAGATGENGINALGLILNGTVNPSGRTVDTNAADFTKDPTWNNFGNNITAGNTYKLPISTLDSHFVEYEEGIYSGYRYYETRGYSDGETWYDDNVVFPFGYGLSYTTFDYEIVSSKTPNTLDGVIEVEVKVTNTGSVDGKETVQLYYNAPYTAGGIEKAQVMLGAYGKTDVIKAGESETITLKMTVDQMKSYDWNDANGNGFKGYELEAGTYNLYVSENAHSWADNDANLTLSIKINEGFKIDTDSKTGNTVENRFDNVSDNPYGIDVTGGEKYLTRSDWNGTWPTVPTADDFAGDMTLANSLLAPNYTKDNGAYDKDQPWYVEEMPTQAKTKLSSEEAQIKMFQLIGKDYDDPMWDQLLDQLTVTQMAETIGYACYQTRAIDTIGKPGTTDVDGPVGFTVFSTKKDIYDTFFYSSGVALASTYNVDLAYAMGEMVGNEGLIGDIENKTGGNPYSGWFAPAANIHRSQFGGRNWEYMSEDGFISGMTSANIIKGAMSKGVYTFMKHFAVNEQETNRLTGGVVGGLVTWTNEQAMREIYLKPFELGVKVGGSSAMMSSFNRIGATWAGGSYELLTEVLRNEWGFVGAIVTDFNSGTAYMDLDQMMRAGGSTNLGFDRLPTTENATATQVSAMRNSMKDLLYTQVNSCVMNGYGEGVVYRVGMPGWQLIMVIIDVVAVVGLAVWGAIVVIPAVKKSKEETNN